MRTLLPTLSDTSGKENILQASLSLYQLFTDTEKIELAAVEGSRAKKIF